MNEFIQRNRGLFKFYHLVTSILGWVLTGITPFLAILSIYSKPDRGDSEANTYLLLLIIRNFFIYYLCLGLILIGLARFIKYLYTEESQQSWSLRHFDKFLYIYALLLIAGRIVDFLRPGLFSNGVSSNELTTLSTAIVFTLAYILIIIGLSHIISKILPVIGESKTLV
ncbi:MAG: hypothetical protein JXA96_18010 [Sedimentisphaerales bacterium]|nr:hypothetical protein [Sedimentisphaerales bacterium]